MFRIFLLVTFVSVSYAYVLPARKLGTLPAPSAERIVGGVETNIEDVPYQVTVLYTGLYRCGGSIVKPNAVVTAAQCTRFMNDVHPPQSLSIRAGSSKYDSGGQVVQCSKYFAHELYDSSKGDYDIAVIGLVSSIIFSESAAPISLPLKGAVVPDGAISVASGWGYTEEQGGGGLMEIIRKVEIPIVNQDICVKAYMEALGMQITPRIICAGEEGKAACAGDQGGPLVSNDTLVGITLFGYGCGRPGYPTMYARVPEMMDWVNEKLSLI